MDVLVLIDKLDDLVHNAKAVPLTDQVRIDREEIYDILDQMRATIPEEIKQARWIVKERQEMLAEAKREVDRLLAEAREQAVREASQTEIVKIAERQAQDIVDEARREAREARLEMEDWADSMLASLEVNLDRFLTAVRRGRERLHERSQETVVGAGLGAGQRRRRRRPRLLATALDPRYPPAVRRTVVEWVVTLAVAALVVLAFEVEVAQPFRVPTSSMEPTLLCARPGSGCTARLNDRVLAAKIVYRFRDPKRGEIAVFDAPAARAKLCTEGGTFLKRVIGLPGEVVSERNGFFYVDGKQAEGAVSLRARPRLRDEDVAGGSARASTS